MTVIVTTHNLSTDVQEANKNRIKPPLKRLVPLNSHYKHFFKIAKLVYNETGHSKNYDSLTKTV